MFTNLVSASCLQLNSFHSLKNRRGDDCCKDHIEFTKACIYNDLYLFQKIPLSLIASVTQRRPATLKT